MTTEPTPKDQWSFLWGLIANRYVSTSVISVIALMLAVRLMFSAELNRWLDIRERMVTSDLPDLVEEFRGDHAAFVAEHVAMREALAAHATADTERAAEIKGSLVAVNDAMTALLTLYATRQPPPPPPDEDP